ncbi:unnamed protein product [Lactuca virosa]|uniref:Plastid lipid-associated protein/fibrillin conserved domain-containing protein n=1 Tax=Lactuca virosa TaxID=75947 RepID=A0AAU9PKF3_9ASTR|nr:unnamed protein product [Lactuca virosa]
MSKKKKKTEKSAAEIALLVENVMAELEVVAEEDAELNRQSKPAINKLRKLPLLTEETTSIRVSRSWIVLILQFPIDLDQYDRKEQLKKSEHYKETVIVLYPHPFFILLKAFRILSLFTAFSELLPLLAVGTTPLLKVDKICQQISTTTLTIDNSIAFSTPFSTFTSTASANLEVKSPSRIQVWGGPLVVMFLFQLYNRLVQTNIPQLLPLMVAAISVPGPDKVSPHLKTHFTELKGAQVKTVSFLTYLLKSFADYIRPHEESICKSIVNLLVTCSDSVSIRKVEPIFEKGVDLPPMDEANILLVNECESISHRIGELISLDGENDQKTSSYPNIPNDFFEEMESSWKNRVKKIHLKESYEEVDKAAEALSLAKISFL